MNKDVIYIDVDDDITAIIGKVKDSKEKIVALVPPKRIGVLQSAVNLRLINRAAHSAHKRLVLITNNQALVGLAAAAQLPVAKNLQSKPGIPEIAALDVDDGDDVIDGAQLPVGELADRTSDTDDDAESETDVAASELIKAEKRATPTAAAARSLKSKKPKVPNFGSFRKRLFLGGVAGVFLIAFLVWAVAYAPRATVVITAKTSSNAINEVVSLSPDAATKFDTGVLKVIKQEQKKEFSVDFTPTGTKNVGEKATGTASFTNRNENSVTIPSGTRLSTDGGLVFVTTSSVTVPGGELSFDCPGFVCAGEASTSITASAGGTKYNAASGNLSGAPGEVNAEIVDATTGGTDRTARVVLASDVQKASQQLADRIEEDKATKDQLQSKFEGTVKVIDGSFVTKTSNPSPSPGVGDEANGAATLTATITYSMLAVAEAELDTFLDAALEKTIEDTDNQQVYKNGADTVKFSDFEVRSGNTSVRLETTGHVGPKIDEEAVKEEVKGKNYGEIQANLEAIEGVDDVDTKFWPFWVRTVPNDVKRITIEFKLNEQG